MTFLFYKLYRFALTQEDTVNPTIGFLSFISVFELLHLVIVGVFLKDNGYDYKFSPLVVNYFGPLFVIIGFTTNYLIFIKSGILYNIDDAYKGKKRNVLKDNLIFFGYLSFLFGVLFLQAYFYTE